MAHLSIKQGMPGPVAPPLARGVGRWGAAARSAMVVLVRLCPATATQNIRHIRHLASVTDKEFNT